MNDWQSIYKDIEDRLAPQLDLDAWERILMHGREPRIERWCRGGKVGKRGFIPIFFEATHQLILSPQSIFI